MGSTAIDGIQFFRALDKYDRLGSAGVLALLTTGRHDESGDFTPGCGLSVAVAECVLEFLAVKGVSTEETIAKIRRWFVVMTMPPADLDRLYVSLDVAGLIEAKT